MLVFIYLKSIQLVTITVKKSTGGFPFDYATYWILTVKVVTHTPSTIQYTTVRPTIIVRSIYIDPFKLLQKVILRFHSAGLDLIQCNRK